MRDSLRRNRFDIIEDILVLTNGEKSKTRILNGANLSYAQFEEYLDLLLSINFLDSFDFNGRSHYKTTEKGFSFLDLYQGIKNLLSKDGNAKEIKW